VGPQSYLWNGEARHLKLGVQITTDQIIFEGGMSSWSHDF